MSKKILFFLLVLLSTHLYSDTGGGVGNGGDGIFCDWREPMTLDYYGVGFAGKASHLPQVVPLYEDNRRLDQIVIQAIDDFILYRHKHGKIAVAWNGVGKKELLLLKNRIKKGVKKYFDYSEWTSVKKIPEIKDALYEFLIPEGCKIKQVAMFKNGKIYVDDYLFSLLDNRQKEMMALHEVIYWIGRKYHGHDNSFFTRNIIRSLLRMAGSNKGEHEIYKSLHYFKNNELPQYLQGIREGDTGSAFKNKWTLNLFDLAGKFNLKEMNNSSCPTSVQVNLNRFLDHEIEIIRPAGGKIDRYQNLASGSILLLREIFSFYGWDMNSFKEKGILVNRDAVLYKTNFESGDVFLIGLNLDNQLYYFNPRDRKECYFKRFSN